MLYYFIALVPLQSCSYSLVNLIIQVVTLSYVVPCVLGLEEHLNTIGSVYLRLVKEALLKFLRCRLSGIFQRADQEGPMNYSVRYL